MTSQELKEKYPLYPVIRRCLEEDNRIMFSTLIRKRYEGKYYLIPNVIIQNADTEEAKTVHKLHAAVYEFLMMSPLAPQYVLDDNQENEVNRLKNIIK